MPIFAFGINYKTAPIEIREKAVFTPCAVATAVQNLVKLKPINEAMILSTCNRTELYTEGRFVNNTLDLLKKWLSCSSGLSQDALEPYIYHRKGQAAVEHIMRVASGMDSMVLGEPQILGQMKDAFALAQNAGSIGPKLGRLLPAVFTVTKQVRTDTAIGANPVSLAYAALSLAKRIFIDTGQCTVLCMGSGDIAKLVTVYLYEQGIKKITLVNRTRDKIHNFATKIGAHCITFRDIPAYLQEADIIISATASQVPILGKGTVESALKERKNRPLLMLDMALPRDIEPEISELEGVYLYNLDNLQEIIKQGYQSRQQAAAQAESIISKQAGSFMRELMALEAVSTIRTYRQHAEQMRDIALNKAYAELAQGITPEIVLKNLSQKLINKLLHKPTLQLRQLAYNGQLEAVSILQSLYKV